MFGNSVRLSFYQPRAPPEVAYDQWILGKQPKATNKRMGEKKENKFIFFWKATKLFALEYCC